MVVDKIGYVAQKSNACIRKNVHAAAYQWTNIGQQRQGQLSPCSHGPKIRSRNRRCVAFFDTNLNSISFAVQIMIINLVFENRFLELVSSIGQ